MPDPTPAESVLGPITPICCTEPGCHWACHGVPDKYTGSRAQILADHRAAEHSPTPESGVAPADLLRDEVAGALYAHDHPTHVVPLDETGMGPAYRESADAALSVLPAPALAVARQLLGTTTAEGEPDVVAYRNTDRPGVLLCREHGEGWLGLTPLTSEDLEDGGFCTWGREYGHECGRDVLIAPTTSAASLGEVVSRLAAHAVGFQDVLDESDRGPWGALILADIAELRALANRPATDAAPPATADRAATLHEAHPPSVEYIAEVLELDESWEYLGAHADPAVAARRRASVTRRYPDAETRTVRKTTTYTVEPEPAAPAAPEEPTL
ncbi:hypothetical protein [Streptomyces anulatus]|uniref:hypothetical protein n=1 Tax=Streptomyces anulatus TaxID=1892 RepID=UPI0032530A69